MEHHSHSRVRISWAGALIAAILVTLLWLLLLHIERERIFRETRQTVYGFATTKGAEISHIINRKIHPVRGLEGLVRLNPNVRQADFETVARNLLKEQHGIRALQLAPGGRITLIYPLKDNEAALNRDLLSDPERGPAARRAITTRQFFLAGPFQLYQGGLGLVGRIPIFIEDRFWGFAQVVLDYGEILKEARIDDSTAAYEFALRGKDELGERGEVIFGRPELFDDADALLAAIALPAGSWQLAAIPRNGWEAAAKIPFTLWLTGMLLIVSTSLLVRLAIGRWLRLRWELEESKNIWRFALEGNGDGVWNWDVRRGEILVSARLREMLGYPAQDHLEHIEHWRAQIHPDDAARTTELMVPVLNGSRDTFADEFRMRCRDGAYRWLLSRGKVFERDETARAIRMIGTHTDISGQKAIEEALRIKDRAIETSIDAIAMANLDGVLVYVNPSFLRLWGITDHDHVVGRSVLDFWQMSDKASEVLQQALTGKGWIGELCAKRSNGETFDVEVVASAVTDQGGRPISLLAAFVDITDRKRAEVSIRQSEERLRNAQALAHVGNWEIDLRNRMMWGSEEAHRIYGYDFPPSELPLERVQRLVVPAYRARLDQALADLLSGKAAYDVEFEIARSSTGERRFVHSKAELIRSPDGNPERIVGVLQDITERKRAEEDRHTLEIQLQQVQRLEGIGALASGIAHDFNNILNAIMGSASLLQHNADDPTKVAHRAEAILQATERGAHVVKQLLTFARKSEIQRHPTDINALVREAMRLLHETFPRTINFTLDLEESVPPVNADANQLHQVLLNLSVNARDAMPHGGTLTYTTRIVARAHVEGRFAAAHADAYVMFSVRDTGEGMSEEIRSRIFDPFYTTKGLGKGTGLGLAVVHGIIQRHEGFIDVTSEVSHGTAFQIYLPLVESTDTDPKVHDDGGTVFSSENELILFVDDEQLLRDYAAEFLGGSGYRVLLASDGDDALAQFTLHRQEVALVLSDYGLPKYTGEELYDRIQGLAPGMPFILLTGFLEPGKREALIQKGICAVGMKPYKHAEILRMVREVLDRGKSPASPHL